jgi:hypothetical protein
LVLKIALLFTTATGKSMEPRNLIHPRIAMAILRHSKIAMTMEVYTQVMMKRMAAQTGDCCRPAI